ncbi:hypothetical protein CDL15_Pgr001199 [Punica granatum]|uniref:Uncharacterized protein n=1 Tax=Punica granatum TaxID=22663 RepID=A0A218WJV3_PUNGR|nr:hypothetical protein CDL15_Pgr001199 [Punica granatum]PKI74385.1 hypothetical protein CRG98_005265 [Punica granatum]
MAPPLVRHLYPDVTVGETFAPAVENTISGRSQSCEDKSNFGMDKSSIQGEISARNLRRTRAGEPRSKDFRATWGLADHQDVSLYKPESCALGSPYRGSWNLGLGRRGPTWLRITGSLELR